MLSASLARGPPCVSYRGSSGHMRMYNVGVTNVQVYNWDKFKRRINITGVTDLLKNYETIQHLDNMNISVKVIIPNYMYHSSISN